MIDLVGKTLGFVPDSVKYSRTEANKSIKKGDRIKIVDNSVGGSTAARDYAGQEGVFHGHSNLDSCWVILDSDNHHATRAGGRYRILPRQSWPWEIELIESNKRGG